MSITAHKMGKIVTCSFQFKSKAISSLKTCAFASLDSSIAPASANVYIPVVIIKDYTDASSATYAHEMLIQNKRMRFVNEGGFTPIGAATTNTLITGIATWVTN